MSVGRERSDTAAVAMPNMSRGKSRMRAAEFHPFFRSCCPWATCDSLRNTPFGLDHSFEVKKTPRW